MIRQGLMYFVIFLIVIYVINSRNLFNMGTKYPSKKWTVVGSVITALLATAIYMVLLYYFF